MSTSLSSLNMLITQIDSLPKKDGSNGVFVNGSYSTDSVPYGGSI